MSEQQSGRRSIEREIRCELAPDSIYEAGSAGGSVMPRYKNIELSPQWEEIYRRFKAVDEHLHGRFLPAFVNHLRRTFRVMAVDNPGIKTLEDLFAWLEKQQPGYMKLEWQWCGMDRQEMLRREKELGLNKNSRREKVSNKYKETNNNDLRI
jgi:hypothetical protein